MTPILTIFPLLVEFDDFYDFWGIFTSGYTDTLGVWFYFIMCTAIGLAYYMKSNNIVASGFVMLLMVVVLSPVLMSIPLGEKLIYGVVVLGVAISLSSIVLRRRAYV